MPRTQRRTLLAAALLAALLLTICAPMAPAAGAHASAQIDKPEKLSYWVGLSTFIVASISSLDENLTWQEMQSRFDVDIEFIHPPVGQESEQFNLMLASRDFPDIIESNWSAYPGGPEKAVSDGVIIALNDLYDPYAPALTAYIEENPALCKQFITDSGLYYVFPSLNKSPYNATSGFYARLDWLEDLGLAIPETIEQMETALRAFKDEKGATAPLAITSNNLNASNALPGAFGVGAAFYVDGASVKYGPLEPGYKAFVETLQRWYADGLLDQDFVAVDTQAIRKSASADMVGMIYDTVGSIGAIMTMGQDQGKEIVMAGMPYPSATEGEKSHFSARSWEYRGMGSAAISTANQYPAFSAQMMDYFYSDEGHILKNFGVEGVSFEYDAEGNPWWNDLIFNNPDGLALEVARSKYVRCNAPYPGFIDGAFHRSQFIYPQQKDAMDIWNSNDDEVVKWILPQLTPTAEEAEELAKITVNIDTFKSEMLIKFIMGQEKLSNYDSFVAELKRMGIERALAIQQTAYDRYQNR